MLCSVARSSAALLQRRGEAGCFLPSARPPTLSPLGRRHESSYGLKNAAAPRAERSSSARKKPRWGELPRSTPSSSSSTQSRPDAQVHFAANSGSPRGAPAATAPATVAPEELSRAYKQKLARSAFPTGEPFDSLWARYQAAVGLDNERCFARLRESAPEAVRLLLHPDGPCRLVPSTWMPTSADVLSLLKLLNSSLEATLAAELSQLVIQHYPTPIHLARCVRLLAFHPPADQSSPVRRAMLAVEGKVHEQQPAWIELAGASLSQLEISEMRQIVGAAHPRTGRAAQRLSTEALRDWDAYLSSLPLDPPYDVELDYYHFPDGNAPTGLLAEIAARPRSLKSWKQLARFPSTRMVALELLFGPGPCQYKPALRFPRAKDFRLLLASPNVFSSETAHDLVNLIVTEYDEPMVLAQALQLLALPVHGAKSVDSALNGVMDKVKTLGEIWSQEPERFSLSSNTVPKFFEIADELLPGAPISLIETLALWTPLLGRHSITHMRRRLHAHYASLHALQRLDPIDAARALGHVHPAAHWASKDPICAIFMIDVYVRLRSSPSAAGLDLDGRISRQVGELTQALAAHDVVPPPRPDHTETSVEAHEAAWRLEQVLASVRLRKYLRPVAGELDAWRLAQVLASVRLRKILRPIAGELDAFFEAGLVRPQHEPQEPEPVSVSARDADV